MRGSLYRGSRERIDRELRDRLGLGPRHENSRPHFELNAAECGPPGEVLQGNATRPLICEPHHPRAILVRNRGSHDRERLHPAPRLAQHVPEKQLCVGSGLDSGYGEQRVDLGQCFCHGCSLAHPPTLSRGYGVDLAK